MKNVKMLLAGLVLCASQTAFAVVSPAQEAAISGQLAAVSSDVNSQALVTSAINAAAAAGVSVEDISALLSARGVAPALISTAINTNISMGGGYTASGAATTLALLGNTGATGAGGNQGGATGGQAGNLASLGSFTTGGTSGGPNGAVSPH